MSTPNKYAVSLFRRIFTFNSIWLSMILSLLVLAGYVLSRPEIQKLPVPAVLDLIEAKTLDLRFHLRGERDPGDDIVIIAVDEKTEDDLGRWHSSGRQWIAQLIDRLIEGQAKIVGFDFVLTEPDEGTVPEVVEVIRTSLERNLSLDTSALTFLDEIQAVYHYDQRLADAIQRASNVILGSYHFFNPKEAGHLTSEQQTCCTELFNRLPKPILKFQNGTTPAPLRVRHSFGVEMNLPLFSQAARSFGHYTLTTDLDGYIRKIPLFIEYNGIYCPSLSLEIVRAALNSTAPPIIHALGREGYGGIDAIQVGKLWIPTDEMGHLLLNFYGDNEAFPVYSLSDVVRDIITPKMFANKIVLVGFTANIYQDLHAMVFNPGSYYGVETHATAIANMLRQEFLNSPDFD